MVAHYSQISRAKRVEDLLHVLQYVSNIFFTLKQPRYGLYPGQPQVGFMLRYGGTVAEAVPEGVEGSMTW
ncbi:hypothetical protein C8Q74DRAFT_1276039 [Fomes fomentarius]|nr:hypothetical protein C8Q74DRAFT_1276039 [Fomes fomentarius]